GLLTTATSARCQPICFRRFRLRFLCVFCFWLPCCLFCFFNVTSPTEIYTLSLHDALPIFFVCLSMVQLMAVFISMRCTLCGHFLQVALTLILVVGYAIAAS